jgi:hypothetical protein
MALVRSKRELAVVSVATPPAVGPGCYAQSEAALQQQLRPSPVPFATSAVRLPPSSSLPTAATPGPGSYASQPGLRMTGRQTSRHQEPTLPRSRSCIASRPHSRLPPPPLQPHRARKRRRPFRPLTPHTATRRNLQAHSSPALRLRRQLTPARLPPPTIPLTICCIRPLQTVASSPTPSPRLLASRRRRLPHRPPSSPLRP